MNTPLYISQDDKYLNGQGLITTIVEVAQSRGIALHKLLRGTGVFEQDLLSIEQQFSFYQQLRLIARFKLLMRSNDSGFLLGEQLINDPSLVTQSVLYSANLGKALVQVSQLRLQLYPLFFSQTHLKKDKCSIFLHPATGLEAELHNYILEIYSGAFYSLLKRMSQHYPRCQFDFSFKRPRYIHEYEQHLGLKIRFEQPYTRWQFDKALLRQPNPNASYLRCMQMNSQLCPDTQIKMTFVEAVYRYLYAQKDASLEQSAKYFAMSPATFKRKLKHHGVRFSTLNDTQKKHKAIYLLGLRSCCNEQVAQQLAFYDTPNFRRAFKRWTGITPSQLEV